MGNGWKPYRNGPNVTVSFAVVFVVVADEVQTYIVECLQIWSSFAHK